MRFGMHIPDVGNVHDLRAIAELAHEADETGWDGCFIRDHILYATTKRPLVDPWIALTAIARRTTGVPVAATPASQLRRGNPPVSPVCSHPAKGRERRVPPGDRVWTGSCAMTQNDPPRHS